MTREWALALACAAAGNAAAQPWDGDSGVPSVDWRGRLELKRINTSRGTPEETTRTALRVETFLDGTVSLLRVDLPFPDADTDFAGSPFDPRLGDIKVRTGFRALQSGALRFPSFLELTVPSANPASLGSGKYLLGAGLRMLAPLNAAGGAHAARFEAELSQTTSFLGDAARADVNYTKLELTFYDLWRERYTLKLKLKPAWDHARDEAGAVAEVEAGFYFGEKQGAQRAWRTWLMLGGRVAGPDDVSSTYNTRVELGLARTF
jgi:hypothetical protein